LHPFERPRELRGLYDRPMASAVQVVRVLTGTDAARSVLRLL